MAESGEGMQAAAAGPSRGPSCIPYPTHCFPVTSCGPSKVSVLQLLLHSVARHGPLELELLESLVAGVAAGDHMGSSEAEWM
jgi:hypothetical protein